MSSDKAGSANRKRGRPSGRNRIPLSLDERRARNAQYERERREATAEATRELAEAAGFPTDISTEELIRRVLAYLRRDVKSRPKESVDDMRRINKKLKAQILSIERQLEQIHVSEEDEGESEPVPEEPAPESPRPAADLGILSEQDEQFLQDLVGTGLLDGVDPSELEF